MDDSKNSTADSSELHLFNILEEVVKERIDKLIESIDMCRCGRCRYDACAIALNSLAPKYVTTNKGALLTQVGYINLDHRTEIDVQVLKALKIVKDKPRH
jgi:competence protein ComFB